MVEMKNLDAKQYFAILVAIILLTDLIILLDVPFLRQILGFLCFTIIPGLLILHVLKLNEIEFLKKFVLSVGLSVAFLMFTGLLVNSLYPLILKPLSLIPILISFSIILIIFTLIAYIRNRNDFDIKDIFNFEFDLKDKLISPLIFPILFPFMTVFGTHLMNTQENNIILLMTLFLIVGYVVASVYLRDRIPTATYPVAIWMLGMSLLLMYGLTSYHLMGRDIHTEFYVFRLVLDDFHWDISKYYHAYNACLSVTILPTVYLVLTNINGEYIFKVLFGLIGSFTPLGIYIISKKYVGERYAFFASLIFIFQFGFVYGLGWARQMIAMLFFVLAILILFDTEVNKLPKKILFLIFVFSVVVSHYTTAYIFFILVLTIWVSLSLKSVFSAEKTSKFINARVISLFFFIIFFWYSQLTQVPFTAGVIFIEQTFRNLSNFFAEELRNPPELAVIGIGWKSIPNMISVIVHDIIFASIGIGVITLLQRYKSYRRKIEEEYFIGILVFVVLSALLIVLPYVSLGYGGTRFFLQALVFLAPVFVIGVNIVAKIMRRPKMDVAIMLIMLISAFFCVTYLQYHFYGIPYSPIYEGEGFLRDESYIYNQELVAASWLNKNGLDYLVIHSDRFGYSRLMLGYEQKPKMNTQFFDYNKTIEDGYIYLRYANVKRGVVYIKHLDIERENILNYIHLFIGKNKIYSNDGSEVWM